MLFIQVLPPMPPPPNPPGLPIDSGVIILIAIGIIYGVSLMRKKINHI